MTRTVKTYLCVIAGLLTVGSLALSQSTHPTTVRSHTRASNDQVREVATEYVDLLQGLRDIISDYSDYLGSDGIDSRGVLETAIDKFSTGLDEEEYLRDCNLLQRDISAVVEKVNAERNRLSSASEVKAQKQVRVLRNFARELQITEELLAEHQARLAELNITQTDVADAIDDDLSVSMKKLKETLEKLAQTKELTKQLYREQTKQKTYVVELPAIPKAPVPTIPTIPPTASTSPVPPRIAVPPIGAPAGVRGMPRELSGTMSIASSSTPIYVSNPSGSVQIEGWGENDVSVSLEVEIAASSRAVEREMIDQISLRMDSARGRYAVRVEFPKLSDPKTRIVASRLTVNVPFSNKVVVDNAFGEMDISDLRGGVDVSGNVSQISLSSIRGAVTIRNSMGAITVSDLAGGPVKITNSYGDVTLSSAEGPISVQNAFAGVSVDESRGELNVVNSGAIDVSTHEGNVHIENSYGPISLDDIKGDVDVRNAFQSISAQTISGLAKLANQYGSITVEEVDGGLVASNTFGSIDISQIRGRLDLNSNNGSLKLNLDGQLSGLSTVTANAGSIYLNLADIKDLLLNARIDGGSVSSGEPIDLTNNGSVKTVQLRLGAGRQALTLQGVGASLVIARD